MMIYCFLNPKGKILTYTKGKDIKITVFKISTMIQTRYGKIFTDEKIFELLKKLTSMKII
ncbi:hypothetical protein BLM37_00025 [Candidatus Gracilibacteria bacterium GN02-873]|nr:hypothetical protein BLM37_00025 [Candidatus Gracilibacteria bacterium GN02-873]